MYSFPTQLWPIPQGMFDDQSAGFGAGIQHEIFYSIKDGNWNDVMVWETVSGKMGKLPGPQDDVYIRHIITNNVTASVKNLYISGTLKATNISQILSVFGNIQCVGNIDFTGSNINLALYGINNSILNFTCGMTSKVSYARLGDQRIEPLNYFDITITGSGIKTLKGNTTSAGTVLVQPPVVNLQSYLTLELSNYSAFFNNVTIYNSGTLSQFGTQNILIAGILNIGQNLSYLNLYNDPNVEIRNGLTTNTNVLSNFGLGLISFTTNDQTVNILQSTQELSNVLISGAIIITNTSIGILKLGVINGSISSSTLINKGIIYFTGTVIPMITGVFDHLSYANTVGHVSTGSYTLPFSSYRSLLTQNSKEINVATSVSEVLTVTTGTLSVNNTLEVLGGTNLNANGILELSGYSCSLLGTITLFSGSKITKSSIGKLLFGGLLNSVQNGTIIDLSTGNPDVEFQNGITIFGNPSSFNFGSGLISFTTNDQTVANTYSIPNALMLLNVLISGAIILTFSYTLGTLIVTITEGLNGDDAGSTFSNKAIVNYQSATMPMLSGILDCSTAANIFKYNLAGDQEVKGGNYDTLEFGGSGVKKLMGDVAILTAYSLTGTATVDLNGFTLTHP